MFFLFINHTATTEIYTLSLHDALPIRHRHRADRHGGGPQHHRLADPAGDGEDPRHRDFQDHGRVTAEDHAGVPRSEEHTSELQSRLHLVCRLLLEKKKKKNTIDRTNTY